VFDSGEGGSSVAGVTRRAGRHRGACRGREAGLADQRHVEVGLAIQKSRSASMAPLTLAICERASASNSNTPISMPL
jgi:hypothetical protein